jgi:hypothetical protein
MQLEEDEQKLKYEKERMALIENKNIHMVRELSEVQEELKKVTKDYQQYFKENHDLRD